MLQFIISNLNFRFQRFFQNDNYGCNSVSWAPFNPATSATPEGAMIYRLSTASCDNRVRVWSWTENTAQDWQVEPTGIQPHKGKYAIVINILLLSDV